MPKYGIKETKDVLREVAEGLAKAKENTADGKYGWDDVKSNIPDVKDIKSELNDWSDIVNEIKDISFSEFLNLAPDLLNVIKLSASVADNVGVKLPAILIKLFGIK